MRSKAILATALASCSLLLAQPGQAATIFDFAGTGIFCTYATGSDGFQSCDSGVAFTGTLILDVIGSPDASSGSSASGNNWVSSAFEISWGGRSHSSFAVGPPGSAFSAATVLNDYESLTPSPADGLLNSFTSVNVNFPNQINTFDLLRVTSDLSWLSGLDFPESLGLAPIPSDGSGFNRLSFEYQAFSLETFRTEGFSGQLELTSMQARSTPLPEPGTLALLSLGLASLGFSLRRKLS